MIALFQERHPRYEHATLAALGEAASRSTEETQVVAVDDGLCVLTRIWVIAEIAEVWASTQMPDWPQSLRGLPEPTTLQSSPAGAAWRLVQTMLSLPTLDDGNIECKSPVRQ